MLGTKQTTNLLLLSFVPFTPDYTTPSLQSLPSFIPGCTTPVSSATRTKPIQDPRWFLRTGNVGDLKERITVEYADQRELLAASGQVLVLPSRASTPASKALQRGGGRRPLEYTALFDDAAVLAEMGRRDVDLYVDLHVTWVNQADLLLAWASKHHGGEAAAKDWAGLLDRMASHPSMKGKEGNAPLQHHGPLFPELITDADEYEVSSWTPLMRAAWQSPLDKGVVVETILGCDGSGAINMS